MNQFDRKHYFFERQLPTNEPLEDWTDAPRHFHLYAALALTGFFLLVF